MQSPQLKDGTLHTRWSESDRANQLALELPKALDEVAAASPPDPVEAAAFEQAVEKRDDAGKPVPLRIDRPQHVFETRSEGSGGTYLDLTLGQEHGWALYVTAREPVADQPPVLVAAGSFSDELDDLHRLVLDHVVSHGRLLGGSTRRRGLSGTRRAWFGNKLPREGRDSNPGASCPANGFQDRRLRPLGHPPGCRV